MGVGFEYHILVHALEGRSGWSTAAKFAAAVRGVIDAHIPADRYHQAGLVRKRESSSESVIEEHVKEWLTIDVNPCTHVLGMVRKPVTLESCWNIFYTTYRGDRAEKRISLENQSDQHQVLLDARKDFSVHTTAPAACKVATFIALDQLLQLTDRRKMPGYVKKPARLTKVAATLGVEHTAAGEVTALLETEGYLSVPEIASRLGCHKRTLERRLQESGLTAEVLRQATCLLRATNRLTSSDSLTTIALDEGYSDLAHMTRAFQTSTGIPPSQMRAAMWLDHDARVWFQHPQSVCS